jgi:hypothetical protein
MRVAPDAIRVSLEDLYQIGLPVIVFGRKILQLT